VTKKENDQCSIHIKLNVETIKLIDLGLMSASDKNSRANSTLKFDIRTVLCESNGKFRVRSFSMSVTEQRLLLLLRNWKTMALKPRQLHCACPSDGQNLVGLLFSRLVPIGFHEKAEELTAAILTAVRKHRISVFDASSRRRGSK